MSAKRLARKMFPRRAGTEQPIFEILAEGLDEGVDGGKGWGLKHERARQLANAAPALREAVKDLLAIVCTPGGMNPYRPGTDSALAIDRAKELLEGL